MNRCQLWLPSLKEKNNKHFLSDKGDKNLIMTKAAFGGGQGWVWFVLRVECRRALKALKCHFELPFQFAASSLASAPACPSVGFFARPSLHPSSRESFGGSVKSISLCVYDRRFHTPDRSENHSYQGTSVESPLTGIPCKIRELHC